MTMHGDRDASEAAYQRPRRIDPWELNSFSTNILMRPFLPTVTKIVIACDYPFS